MTVFCTNDRFGWGWDAFVREANEGEGMKVQQWMKPIFKYVVPIIVIALYIIGLKGFQWR
jgi:NSS family neurotransmitter:Na+ symporter